MVKISAQQKRTLIIGGIASLIAWGTLVFLVQIVHLAPQVANIPSLIIGSLTQFLGNRFFVFKATERHYAKQAVEYVGVETAAFFLNASLFSALVTWTPIYYAAAQPVSSLCIFIFFSYPMWKLVFRKANKGK